MIRRVGSLFVPFCNRSYQLLLQKQKPSRSVGKVWFAPGRNSQINIAYFSETMSSPVTPEMNLNYQDIVHLTGDKSIVLIDVREPQELKENGVLPNSVNIPLSDVKGALQCTTDEEFQSRYGIPLPDKDAPIVFSCHAGGRSMKALLAALELGFKNAKHYAGGFSDWKKNTENLQ